ncbi:bifunctional tRNA (5-methylaminomethyl-2-thiouridine)(34)-methyltransferase MnmD/FAD-dependent 5-carboxymethylaminomethyl-2-thiouridine(34) oxidoreductase MnmC [Aquabacterium sp. A7-Y]|uniref:bifunctional tRNA (5-methylaminomethyl-2-thiouridine)(34)-methyltransferase MnmD/FAD-dependent 5-carboxymethylaminomethyl-2-thiouridine(34) oxidoreductase MnmC n=1 Tax=Aquabacterium sp. A7-Y TaxID=1349605 RepID=UPI00223D9AB3|nr:bifunctional tRNA (5-methylaminomethyl-2-thiouridine)(34)-methyltransferase MnmD/FAD-dependent 5-carboxymethylaminomethyl-2-thiouridine(34) oxidoreductase MnmC [Aquabacterium sp. A7-Y]MCW7541595.1 bifunctional tRNA (5-methylaminomethyl-2-thiouridine)(34)-methyltransferase MnmD/FAD-dependent 5-carboxymethylaminomethyl-2-thiouridine(34) oxidoreductase MnmC [Aquabacterium sp. A7-Y]
MKTEALRPARIAFNEAGLPWAPDFGDVYHSSAGALAQARHVFLGGNGLPGRWRGRRDFVVLETGFGLGNNFLATWQAWREDPARSERLQFISIEKHPATRDDLARVHAAHALPQLASQLVTSWPALTPNLHALDFEDGRVRLLLGFGEVAALLPELRAEVDAFFLDGFAPSKNPGMWERRVLKGLGRLAAPGATAATWSAARAVRDGLTEAGFSVEAAAGFGGKRDMTVARFEPRFVPPRLAAWQGAPASSREAVVVGGGLAGCTAAVALARRGWSCTVLDRHPVPAREASGNAGGLFHGIVNPQDGAHARFNRAAALHLERRLRDLRRAHPIAGQCDGLLRLEAHNEVDAMARQLDALALPPDYVQGLDARQASEHSGLPLQLPAWYYPGGGWLRPGDLCAALLRDAPGIRWRGSVEVAALRQAGEDRELLDATGTVVARAPVVVLANSADAARLLGPRHWPLSAVRGQTTSLPATASGLRPARLPVAGAGYVLPPHDGRVWCGATTGPGDADPSVRWADHEHNLAQLARLTGSMPDVDASTLSGRVGWRNVSDDRLPVIGPVPDERCLDRGGLRLDHARYVPRHAGLYVYTGLASRGITWSLLGAEVLAAWVAGDACPLENDLRDALDAARFVSRAARRQAG